MKFLDLGQYKKTSMDNSFATFDHPKGHKIQVFLKGLSKLQQEQLKRLPMASGGVVKDPEDEDESPESQARTAMRRERSPGQSKDGAGRKYFDSGTPNNTVQSDDPDQLEVEPVPQQPAQGHTINIFSGPQGAAAPAPATPDQSSTPQSQPQAQPVPAPAALLQGVAQNTLAAGAQGQQGIQEETQYQADLAKAQIPVEEAKIKAQQDYQTKMATALSDVNQHVKDFDDYQKANPVDPQAYYHSQTDQQRQDTALGLALGGLGSALTGGPNQVLDFVKSQMDRSIQAQKDNIHNRATVLGAYEKLYGNETAAAELTKASMLDQLSHRANVITAGLATQQAKANNDKLQSQFAIDKQDALMKAAGYLATNSASAKNEVGQPLGGRADRILAPGAQNKYNAILYDPTKTPEQKSEAIKEYTTAVQIDKALDQVDVLFPQLAQKATWTGSLTEPLQDTAESLTAHGGVTGAIAGLANPLIKGAARLTGGQQEVQYRTAKESLKAIVAGALHGLPVTPTEAGKIVDQFIPDKFDTLDEETLRDKLEKMKAKIINLTKTGTLDSIPGMTNK